MYKESKSCTGVLLRANLIRHGHPTCFGRKGWLGWPCPVRTHVQGFNSLYIVFYYNIRTTHPKIGDLFCPVHISGLSHSVCTCRSILNFTERHNINDNKKFGILEFRDFFIYTTNQTEQNRVGKTGSLGPQSRVIVYCSKLSS